MGGDILDAFLVLSKGLFSIRHGSMILVVETK